MTMTSVRVLKWLGTLALAVVAPGCSGDDGLQDSDAGAAPQEVVEILDIKDFCDTARDTMTHDFKDDDIHLETTQDTPYDPGKDQGTMDEEGPSCECAPPSVSVTVNSIPSSMNGSKPYLDSQGQMTGFRLAVPPSGFVWNLSVDCPCGYEADGLKAWTNLADREDLSHLFNYDGNGSWSWMVDEAHAFPEKDAITLHADVSDVCGHASEQDSLIVRAVAMTPMLDPFDLEDPWLLTYTRDFYAITWTMDPGGNVELQADEGANGVPDFIEDLWTIGMGTPNPTQPFTEVTCEGGTGGNECLARLLLGMVRDRMYPMFERLPDGTSAPDSVNIRFLLEGEAGAPDPIEFEYQFLDGTEDAKAFSMIGFGGGNLDANYVGMSESLDLRNVRNENNARKDYGVMTTSLIRYFYELLFADPSVLELAQLFLGDLLPTMGGVPIGEREGDELAVDMDVPDVDLAADVLGRRQKMLAAMELVCGGIAALTSHEVGHSLGLVPYGPPPHGLFADEDKAEFIENPGGSVGPHIDTAGQNLMQAGPGSGNLPPMSIGFLMSPWFFNELNLAYLQGRIVLLPKE